MQTTETLLGLLDDLDAILRQALELASARGGVRGLHLDADEVRAEFGPGAPMARPPRTDWVAVAARHGPLRRLAGFERMTALETGLLIVALAPEIHSRFARAYALLQDDVARRRPGLDFALSLLSDGDAERLAARAAVEGHGGALDRRILLRRPGRGPAAEDGLEVDPQIRQALGLGGHAPDPRLASFCRLHPAAGTQADVVLDGATLDRLRAAREAGTHAIHLRTASPTTARLASGIAAATWDRTVLEVDVEGFAASGENAVLVARDCTYLRRMPLLRLGEAPPLPALAGLLEALRAYGNPVVTTGPERWAEVPGAPLGPVTLDLRRITPAARLAIWTRVLTLAEVTPPAELGWIAGRFSLDAEATAAAASEAAAETLLDGETAATGARLARAARRQTGTALGKLAQRIEPRHGWDALVLPDDTTARLREISARLRNSERVLEDWGFGALSRAAHRTAALFAGPSGTGKTLAAEVIAHDLGVDLYRVDLARVVDKYVGETEKNLDRIFSAAEEQDCLLFLDECEVLLGKRSEQREGRDKYANLEAAFLLQRIDEFRGTALMATNLLGNVDEAFIRRLDFVVHFPFPDEAQRAALWRANCPEALPLAADVDFDALAHSYRLSGGNIANCLLAAAFLAAEAGGPVTQGHLLHAVRREYQKMGQSPQRI